MALVHEIPERKYERESISGEGDLRSPLMKGVSRWIRSRRYTRELERNDWDLRKENMNLRKENEALHYDVTHDDLTGCLNERGLREFLEQGESPAAILYLDGTNQKAVNDRFDHSRGDEAIKGMAEAIKRSLRPTDVVARVGGDEFVAVLSKARSDGNNPDKNPIDVLEGTVNRIKGESQTYLNANPHLAAVGFDIAVGGTLWEAGMSVNDARLTAEASMYANKAEQHAANGQYRSGS